LVFDPFGITSAPRGPSERYGIEVSNTYLLNGWLMVDADYSVSEAHFLDPELDPVSGLPDSHVDQAVNCVFAGGPSIRLPNGFFTSLHYKYLGPRYLTPDGTLLSKATNLVDLSIG